MFGMEQGQLLRPVDPVLGVVDVPPSALPKGPSTTRRGTWAKLSQNRSIIAAIMRSSATRPGLFSSRETVGCEHRSPPLY